MNKMNEIWQHSIDVAAICYTLAKKMKGLHPEEAMMAGLLHDIGAIPIIQYAAQYEDIIKCPALLDRCITELKAELGGVILDKWQFDEKLVGVAKYCEQWGRQHKESADYIDLVIIAQLHTFIGQKAPESIPKLTEVPAFHKIGAANLTPEQSIEILDAAKAEIEAARQLLMS